jgi:trehalose-phosphatase
VSVAFPLCSAVPKLQAFLGLTGNIICAGSHGFEIQGSTAAGAPVAYHIADEYLVTLQAAFRHLQSRLASVDGASVEDNKYSVTAHWRNVQEDRVGEVEAAVDEFIASPGACREDGSRLLIKRPGKRVFEIRPAVDWHKGRAVRRILEELLAAGGSGSGGADVAVVILGDDHTDEDMFAAAAELQAEASAHGRKVSCFPILVAQPVEDGTAPDGAAASASGADATSDTAARLALMPRETKATAYLQDPSDVRRFLEELRSSLA